MEGEGARGHGRCCSSAPGALSARLRVAKQGSLAEAVAPGGHVATRCTLAIGNAELVGGRQRARNSINHTRATIAALFALRALAVRGAFASGQAHPCPIPSCVESPSSSPRQCHSRLALLLIAASHDALHAPSRWANTVNLMETHFLEIQWGWDFTAFEARKCFRRV